MHRLLFTDIWTKLPWTATQSIAASRSVTSWRFVVRARGQAAPKFSAQLARDEGRCRFAAAWRKDSSNTGYVVVFIFVFVGRPTILCSAPEVFLLTIIIHTTASHLFFYYLTHVKSGLGSYRPGYDQKVLTYCLCQAENCLAANRPLWVWLPYANSRKKHFKAPTICDE